MCTVDECLICSGMLIHAGVRIRTLNEDMSQECKYINEYLYVNEYKFDHKNTVTEMS